MRIESDIKLGFKDVLIRPKRSTLSSRSQVELNRTFTFVNSGKTWTGVPIIAANMDTVGSFEMAVALAEHKMITAVHKHYSIEQWSEFLAQQDESIFNHIMVSTGTSQQDMAKLNTLMSAHPELQFICVDVANGYSEAFVNFVRSVRQQYPETTLIAGNVVTGEMVEELILAGADVIKVGIGPGSVCTTRVKTGVGYPQLSAVIECADAAHGLGGQIISDGGCAIAGDLSKAFGGGADFIMLGGMLAGHDEAAGDLIERDGKQYKRFYGMSSATAMGKHAGGVAEYRASEGKTVEVPYRGPVNATVLDFLGGIRSACTYVGARQLKELSKRTTFIRVQEQENQVFGKE
ncbi:GMP reductase [Neiella sp. HB171785]|uniref:GMP reductase n=1 Tax=Neiella litorisoli TaxID=2771431 RepID=A0A8J6QRY3_9GAMM|nr:GMP reductase [Neiella litorisoli]MBD1389599.1 GMP reductase [Neiella litorisoli]